MTKDLVKIGTFAVLIVAFCGWGALGVFLKCVGEILVVIFPFIWECIEYAMKDHFTSPYFITGVIMAIASCFGIWFGAKNGKRLYLIISLVGALISLANVVISLG